MLRSTIIAATTITTITLVLQGIVACSHSSPDPTPASTCPQDLPATCPSPPPSYKNDVADILDARCNRCHGSGGSAAEKPLTDYASVYRLRSGVLNQTYSCNMPPKDEKQLTTEQRAALLQWLVCGAPNN